MNRRNRWGREYFLNSYQASNKVFFSLLSKLCKETILRIGLWLYLKYLYENIKTEPWALASSLATTQQFFQTKKMLLVALTLYTRTLWQLFLTLRAKYCLYVCRSKKPKHVVAILKNNCCVPSSEFSLLVSKWSEAKTFHGKYLRLIYCQLQGINKINWQYILS